MATSHRAHIEELFDMQDRRVMKFLDEAERRVIAARRDALQVTVDTHSEDLNARVPHATGPRKWTLSQLDREQQD